MADRYKNKPIDAKTLVIGEIGLAGEIRSVNQVEQRIKEAKKLGFTNIIEPSKVSSLKEALQLVL